MAWSKSDDSRHQQTGTNLEIVIDMGNEHDQHHRRSRTHSTISQQPLRTSDVMFATHGPASNESSGLAVFKVTNSR
jgi:hypothetical protein